MRPLVAAFLFIATTFVAAPLTPDEQRQAGLYTEILRTDPTHALACQGLGQIYRKRTGKTN